DQEIGVLDCPLALLDDERVQRIFTCAEQPACIEQLEALAAPNDGARERVTSCTGDGRNNCAPRAGHAVEQRGLSDVGPANQHNRWAFLRHLLVHLASALTA